jgi:apolipoprotein D and lipocalin family protein
MVPRPALTALLAACLLAGAAVSAAFASGCGGDAPLDVAPNVDLGRFQGKWYEIARLPRFTQTGCYGTTAFYSQAAGSTLTFVNQCNVGSATGPLKTVSMSASVPNAAIPAKLAVNVGGYLGDYWILEVGSSYEYAVVGHPSRAYLWVLSRTPTLDAGVLQGVVDRAQARHFDTSQLQYTPQPPAGERAALTGPEGPVPAPLSTGCQLTGAPFGGDLGFGPWVLCCTLRFLRRRSSRSRV